jgi:nicotinamide mononucleotide adenylyltransferase
LTGRLCGNDNFIKRIESEETEKTTKRPKIVAVTYFQAIIEVENRLRKDESFRKIVEKFVKDFIKQAKKKYFITIA